jgi:diguanylate cyclase (GGDEF)-like protein
MCLADKTIKENKFVEEQEYMKHKDGYRVPVLSNVWAFKDNDGKVAGVVHMFTNRTAKLSAFEKIEKLKKLAFIDELTGVGNRRYTEIKILTKLQEMEKFKGLKEFGILFIDIDRFKDFNDKYGHGLGDKILHLVAQTIINNIRTVDFVGRWGGEEFLAIISDVSDTDLIMIAEKLRVLVANSSVKFGNGPINVTISIGATMAQESDSITQLIDRADKLMYSSKKIGRNLVTAG